MHGCTICAGGYIGPSDLNPILASVRETKEESDVIAVPEFMVGIYGPERYHHIFVEDELIRTEQAAHVRPVVAFVFAGRLQFGVPTDTPELRDFKWVPTSELRDGRKLVFDHARVLDDFESAIKSVNCHEDSAHVSAMKLIR